MFWCPFGFASDSKRLKEEEDAARAYKEFVASFDDPSDGGAGGRGHKAFVRAGASGMFILASIVKGRLLESAHLSAMLGLFTFWQVHLLSYPRQLDLRILTVALDPLADLQHHVRSSCRHQRCP